MLGAAPDFAGTQTWFNTARRAAAHARRAARPVGPRGLLDLHLHQLHPHAAVPEGVGRALPEGRARDRRRAHARVPFRDATRRTCSDAIAQNRLTLSGGPGQRPSGLERVPEPVLAGHYLIDGEGRVRYVHFGEGDYGEKEDVIRELLRRRAGARARRAGARGPTASPGVTTPETYLGAARAERFANGPIRPGTQEYKQPSALRRRRTRVRRRWKIGDEAAERRWRTRGSSSISARVTCTWCLARARVCQGLSTCCSTAARYRASRRPRRARGSRERRAPAAVQLVDLPRAERHRLTLEPRPRGVRLRTSPWLSPGGFAASLRPAATRFE